MTPNEIAHHLMLEARKHGAQLKSLTFTTAGPDASGQHSYEGYQRRTLEMRVAETIAMEAPDDA